MIKTFSWALVITASVGLVNVPHAIFYEHPSLLFARFMRHGDEHSG
ncbi:hypothetical protein RCXUPER_154 [Rhodobacter phage RcXuper]|nr:hypothetical protein RCXUPER_154 [Rhodobacter phage RcXuper]